MNTLRGRIMPWRRWTRIAILLIPMLIPFSPYSPSAQSELFSPQGAQELMLSISGWKVTIVSRSGLGTSAAQAIGIITPKNAFEYCQRESNISIPHGGRPSSAQCAQDLLLREHGRQYKITADCTLGIIQNFAGVFSIRRVNSTGERVWRNENTHTELNQHGFGTAALSAQFNLLCPSRLTSQSVTSAPIDASRMVQQARRESLTGSKIVINQLSSGQTIVAQQIIFGTVASQQEICTVLSHPAFTQLAGWPSYHRTINGAVDWDPLRLAAKWLDDRVRQLKIVDVRSIEAAVQSAPSADQNFFGCLKQLSIHNPAWYSTLINRFLPTIGPSFQNNCLNVPGVHCFRKYLPFLGDIRFSTEGQLLALLVTREAHPALTSLLDAFYEQGRRIAGAQQRRNEELAERKKAEQAQRKTDEVKKRADAERDRIADEKACDIAPNVVARTGTKFRGLYINMPCKDVLSMKISGFEVKLSESAAVFVAEHSQTVCARASFDEAKLVEQIEFDRCFFGASDLDMESFVKAIVDNYGIPNLACNENSIYAPAVGGNLITKGCAGSAPTGEWVSIVYKGIGLLGGTTKMTVSRRAPNEQPKFD